jgi:hypothetical protein
MSSRKWVYFYRALAHDYDELPALVEGYQGFIGYRGDFFIQKKQDRVTKSVSLNGLHTLLNRALLSMGLGESVKSALSNV